MLLHKVSQVVAPQRDVNVSLHFAKPRDLLTAAGLAATQERTSFGAIRACGGRGAKKRDGAPSSRDWAASVSNI